MALLTPNDTLLPAYIHPDRVAFQFCYASPPNATAYAARILLKQLVTDGRDMPGMALSFTIPVEGLASRVRVKFTKPNTARPFFFKVYLSPLTLLRQPLILDRSKDGQMNFLTAAQTSLDNSFVAAAERIKAYEKGARRVRLECALEKCALEKVLGELGSSRKLDDPDDFVRACRTLAVHAAERFAHFSNIHVRTSTDPSPAQLIALASKGYLADFAEQSLLILARTGRIRRSANSPLVKAWEKRGIVRSTCHGFYTVTDLFRSALEAFRQLADAWAAGTDRRARQIASRHNGS